MALTPSTMLPLGTACPEFALPDTAHPDTSHPDSEMASRVRRDDFIDSPGLLVMFICNHCPYVVYLKEALAAFAEEYQPRGIAVVAISSNDIDKYPQDGPASMGEDARRYGYGFPYLFDEDQAVAHAFTAACTPDFFLFGPAAGSSTRPLVYRGRFDTSRPGNDEPITGADLRAACDALLAHPSAPTIPEPQIPSMGCNIKWKPGNEPSYFG